MAKRAERENVMKNDDRAFGLLCVHELFGEMDADGYYHFVFIGKDNKKYTQRFYMEDKNDEKMLLIFYERSLKNQKF